MRSVLSAQALVALALVTGCHHHARHEQAPDAACEANADHPRPGAEASGSAASGMRTSKIALTIASPKEGEVVAGPDLAVSFDLQGYAVAQKGPHVHLILDNEPYKPVYDVSQPFVLKGMKPGNHTLRAFPSTAWHESQKVPGAFTQVNFAVGQADGGPKLDPSAPTLTYSRPKGEYAGTDAQRILLDFYVTNATLSETGYRVRRTVDGQSALLTRWEPTYLEGLASGSHTIKLELLDARGRAVPGPYNVTERTITVR